MYFSDSPRYIRRTKSWSLPCVKIERKMAFPLPLCKYACHDPTAPGVTGESHRLCEGWTVLGSMEDSAGLEACFNPISTEWKVKTLNFFLYVLLSSNKKGQRRSSRMNPEIKTEPQNNNDIGNCSHISWRGLALRMAHWSQELGWLPMMGLFLLRKECRWVEMLAWTSHSRARLLNLHWAVWNRQETIAGLVPES